VEFARLDSCCLLFVTIMLDDWNWTVGVVVSAFGIRGEMKVRLETDFPDRFQSLKQVCLRGAFGANKAASLYDVKGARLHKNQVLLSLVGIDKIEQVDELRGYAVQIRREEAVKLPANSYYSVDLVGMAVVTRQGRVLGKLEKILAYPAYDLFQVGEALIPAVKEIVIEVDTAGRRIVVDPPAGMLPGDEPETVE
jgi:16S rRNA processing protein RimM